MKPTLQEARSYFKFRIDDDGNADGITILQLRDEFRVAHTKINFLGPIPDFDAKIRETFTEASCFPTYADAYFYACTINKIKDTSLGVGEPIMLYQTKTFSEI